MKSRPLIVGGWLNLCLWAPHKSCRSQLPTNTERRIWKVFKEEDDSGMAQRATRVFKGKGNQKRKEAWSVFICTPSSSHWIAFVPVVTLCQEPDKASLGWTILVSLYLAKDEAAFTFLLFLGLFLVVSRDISAAPGSSSWREERRKPVMSRALWETLLRSSASASSFNLHSQPTSGVLLSPLHREGNSSSEELGNLPQVTGLKGDRTHIQIQIFLSLKKAFHRTSGQQGSRPSSAFGKWGRTVCFLNCDMMWHRKI